MTDQFDERARELLRPIFPDGRPDTPLSITMRDTIAAALRETAEAARREALDELAAETERLGLYPWQGDAKGERNE